MSNRALVLALSLALGVDVACGDVSVSAAPADAGTAATPSLAEVLTLDTIVMYQGVKLPLVEDGQPKASKVPVIPNRPALVRVHASKPFGAKVGRIVGELRVQSPGHEDVVLSSGPIAVTPFADGDLESTLNFELSAEQVVRDTRLSVEIREADAASGAGVRYPAEGELALDVSAFAPTLKVKLVPFRYQANGANRLPPLDEDVVESYRQGLYRLYPVSEVDLSVRAAVNWTIAVEPTGEGWDQLLRAISQTRSDDKAAEDVYYVGIFTPKATEREFCAAASCILGIAPAKSGLGDNPSDRVALVLGYPSERANSTLAQEIAHAMGRLHAPCGKPQAIDPKYPYPDANIGGWGYDIVTKELVDPNERSDFMSYCRPTWVSDYTYTGIYERMRTVAAAMSSAR